MISLTVLATTPEDFKAWLIAQSVGKTDEKGNIVGTLSGLEVAEVPNVIVATPAVGTPSEDGYVPAVMDARHVYLVKMAHEMLEAQEAAVDAQPVGGPIPVGGFVLESTKVGTDIKANSVEDQNDARLLKINATNVWVVKPEESAPFGVWQ